MIAVIGFFLSFVFFLPLLSTPTILVQAESDFGLAFGSNWRSKIDSSVNQYFMDSQFNLAEYLIGNQPKHCNIDQNITFYEGEGITLCYDAYYPQSGGTNLPGNNSVLINIHGGAWVAGDKGAANMLQVSKYFAAQGYVVFDIQYGLIEDSSSWIPTPDYVKGNFSLDDQVRHIGIFIKQLNDTEFSKYNLNLNSVFITGNSAGGHLTIATSLMIQSGNYTSLFGSNIKVKGMIPLYPGDPPERFNSSTDKFRNPENFFINESSMPCLIFQGTKDFCLLETQHIKNQYDAAGNNDCCVIWFPFQGHANDLYYSGHFNQFKLYYMERFLYLCRTNQIE
jgi:dienelactone hydrolase